MAGCSEEEVSLEYDHGPGLAVVTLESGGGLPYPGDDLLPAFQLLSDGSFITCREGPNGRDLFMHGTLDEAAITDLLRRIYEAGFFDLEDEYVDPDVYDATYRRISIDLAETEKTVTVWMTEDVPVFDAAYKLVLDYPLGEVTEYVPDEGYLVVVKYPVESMGETEYLDPESEVFELLPDIGALMQAAAGHVAIAVDGETFMRLKTYDNAQESAGLLIRQPDAILAVYPVYEPRTAEKP